MNRGNFLELLSIIASFNDEVTKVLDKALRNASYTSSTIQKHILQVLATKVKSAIREEIGNAKFCIIVDEARDESKKEQMSIVLKFVDRDGFIQERFFGVVHVKDTSASTLKEGSFSILSRHNLDVQNIRGRGYDGASNMHGEWNGLKALISDECPYVYYVHCFIHRLQLALVASLKEVISAHHFFTKLNSIINVVGLHCRLSDCLNDPNVLQVLSHTDYMSNDPKGILTHLTVNKKPTCAHTATTLCHKAIITRMGTVITTPNATPGRLHHSLRDDGVTTTPQDVVSILRSHTSTSGTHAGRASLKAPKPPRDSYVYRWIVDNLAVSRDDEIFRYKAYKASWGNVASLQEGNKVAYRVVDTWACVLNYRELTKDAVIPNRLFASTKTVLQSAVNYTALRSLRLGWFTKSIDEDFSNSPHETWRGIHIYIFTILQQGHFYMISVDTIAKKVDIIDSSFVAETKDKLYGQTPKQFVDLLSTFLDDKLETEIASQIRDLIPKRMQMSWRVPKNQVDSAVFTMRHMESYRGQGIANWDVGLQRGNYMQICVLRQYFMREILMSDINIHHNSNIKRALNFANGLARNTPNIV
nr:zinc finger MYM-type protein 1-like [Ipomoea batatas]